MKILYVIPTLTMGGAERIVINLADSMSKKGYKVKVLYFKGDIQVYPKDKKVEVECLNISNVFDLPFGIIRFKNIISRFAPDVVHAHMYHANIFTRFSRIFIKMRKLICSAHSSIEGTNFGMFLYKISDRLSNTNTNVSKDALEKFIRNGAFKSENSLVVYNGIDIDRYKKIAFSKNNTVNNFISIGRLAPEKDFPNLINAIEIIRNKYNINIKLNIIGGGIEYENLHKMINEKSLHNTINLLGSRDDIVELLNHADCLVSSSKFEGLPTVIIEAMACQCFVIATDCGGSKEIMQNTGILVEPESPEKLALAIINYLMMSNEGRNILLFKARKIIEEKFNISIAVENWEKIYCNNDRCYRT